MLKQLVKKQMAEIFRSYLYDAKKSQKRAKGTVILYFALFVFLMVGVLGGMFTFVAMMLCDAMAAVGMGWLYFTLMGLVAIFMGAFGSVFNTYSSLYLAKDNDLLLSLPIPLRARWASPRCRVLRQLPLHLHKPTPAHLRLEDGARWP